MDCYEAVSGRGLHAAYYRAGGVYRDLPDTMPQYQASMYKSAGALKKLNENRQGSAARLHRGTSTRRFPSTWTSTRRCSPTTASGSRGRSISASFRRSGARARVYRADAARSGVEWDLRKKQPYAVYDRVDFDIPVGVNGDCYDRYLVRVEEMRQSKPHHSGSASSGLRENPGPVITDNHKVAPPSRVEMKSNMEELIHHFKLFTEGIHVPPGEAYAAVEHPKGEFGVYILSDGANKPYRMKIRAAGFPHLAALNEMTKGHMLADVVAIIGTQDIVFGEIDR